VATRSRAGMTRACVALLMIAAGCSSGSHATGADRPTAPAAANSRSEVADRAPSRSPIVVTPYERQAFLELAMQPVVSVRGHRAVLERWTTDPTLAISGAPTPEDLRQVNEAIQRWSFITGRRLTITTGPAAVAVHFVPRAGFSTALDVDRVDATAVGLTRVSFARGHRGRIAGGVVVIASDDDQVTRNRTIAHELGHVMGLQHSTCASSLMDGSSDGERSVRWSPSALDIRMGALLYDPRLEPGMSRSDLETTLTPTVTEGAVCGPVDLELIRAAGSGRHYFCVRSTARFRPCTSNVSQEPTLPLVGPDAWTDGSSLSADPPG
jgi:hypothetical protein